jgi:hypothetical protein
MRRSANAARANGGTGGGADASALTALTVLTALTALSCIPERATNSPTVRDSAGVTIVAYDALRPDPLPWTIGDEPVVEIGAVEGDEAYQLGQVAGVTRLSDGRIVIADGGTLGLRFYDATGRHLVTAGRKGQGPGEFDGLWSVWALPGDTIMAYDGNLKRVSVFTPDGAFVRSFNLDFAQGFPQLGGMLTDGTLIGSRGFAFQPSQIDGVIRDTAPVLRFAADGTFSDSVGRWLSREYYVHGTRNEAWASSLPFGRSMTLALGRGGFYVGSTERFEIEWRDGTGRLSRIVRATPAPVPVTAADLDRVKAERMESADANWRRRQERMFAEMPVPSTRPAFGVLEVDPEGNLWVGESIVSARDSQPWIVFGPDGRLRGSIVTPAGFSVREIGQDYLLGTSRDEMDVERVRMYRLGRVP